MRFFEFLATPLGRSLRGILGLSLILWGSMLGTTGGLLLAGIGFVALLTALINVCLLAPLFGAPLRGEELSTQGHGTA